MNILHNGAITLHHGDCLDLMRDIPDGSVDAIICDPPFGTTACKWDVVIPFEPMWAALKRIIKPRGAIVLFGSQPFTSALVMSNVGMFKYQWIWKKTRASNFASVRFCPMLYHEDIVVFHGQTYKPIMREDTPYHTRITSRSVIGNTNKIVSLEKTLRTKRYPSTVIEIPSMRQQDRVHPTQKPVALLEYLIRTYTNEGETVLDFTFGSCSAGVAALTTKRRFIGIERDATYYALGVQRVQTAIDNLPPMDV